MGATSASAGKPQVTGVGTVSCSGGSGKAKISPPFKQVPQTGQRITTSKFKTTCTGTTGNPAVTLASAKITATSTSVNASTTCTELIAGGDPQESFDTVTSVFIKWKATGGKVDPTNITFTSILVGVPATGFTNPGPTGQSIITGSYAGEDAVSAVTLDPGSLAGLVTACNSTKDKGIKKFVFGGAGGLTITP
jgi:hypothetical protein